jgi:hypothetical protein
MGIRKMKKKGIQGIEIRGMGIYLAHTQGQVC